MFFKDPTSPLINFSSTAISDSCFPNLAIHKNEATHKIKDSLVKKLFMGLKIPNLRSERTRVPGKKSDMLTTAL